MSSILEESRTILRRTFLCACGCRRQEVRWYLALLKAIEGTLKCGNPGANTNSFHVVQVTVSQ